MERSDTEEVGLPNVLDRFFQKNPDKREVPFVIFGAGYAGRENIRSLRFLGIKLTGCGRQ